MKKIRLSLGLIIGLALLLSACIKTEKSYNQQEALEIAWKTLDPNTTAHNRDDWEIHAAAKVRGSEVVKEFAQVHPANCPGPVPPDNMPIKLTSEYWYIKVLPHPEALRPSTETESPDLVLVKPEPNITEAEFLINLYGGEVVARKIICK